MSWLVVFISSFVPIVLLFILLITDWLHGESRSTRSSLKLWGGMKDKDRWDGFAGSKLLTQFLILAGSVALAIAQGIVLLFILLIMYWLHGEPRSKLSLLRLGGMKEKDRWDGFADSTRYAAIPLRASPSKTRMR
jgi:hypothetical protein